MALLSQDCSDQFPTDSGGGEIPSPLNTTTLSDSLTRHEGGEVDLNVVLEEELNPAAILPVVSPDLDQEQVVSAAGTSLPTSPPSSATPTHQSPTTTSTSSSSGFTSITTQDVRRSNDQSTISGRTNEDVVNGGDSQFCSVKHRSLTDHNLTFIYYNKLYAHVCTCISFGWISGVRRLEYNITAH